MEGKGSFFVLLIIVALLSITIAALAIGYFFLGNKSSAPATSETTQHITTKEAVKDSELAAEPYKLFASAESFNLKKSTNSDKRTMDVILVTCELKYRKSVKGLSQADPKVKIEFFKEDIIKLMGDYFLHLTYDDVSKPEVRKKMEEDLVEEINKILMETEDKSKVKTPDIVTSVTLGKWFFQ